MLARSSIHWYRRAVFSILVCTLLPLTVSSAQAEVRDGRLFDPGVERTERAEGAPEALDLIRSSLGDWTFDQEFHTPGNDPVASSGRSRITYMNRGYGYMERTRIDDFDGEGHAMHSIGFLSVDANGTWSLAEGNSWTEALTIWSGGVDGGGLSLRNALRPGGSSTLVELRRSYTGASGDAFTMRIEASSDAGESWAPVIVRNYRRASESGDDFFPVRDDVGLPSPDRAPEATEFDFLLGEFDGTHWLNLQGNVLQWRSNATAVYALGGHAILEFDWHDNDPSIPAATTLLRLYNRSMRRWESFFLTNRSNSPLHFGGVREGDRIVLHPFNAQTGANPLSQWIFHDDRPDAYRWKGLRSTDRGKTWPLYWGIDFQRKGTEPTDLGTPIEVSTKASDGTRVFGDHYRPSGPAAKSVLLFHQAGGDARGEYGAIVERLLAEGYEVFAWDARSGGDRFGGTNRTVAALGASNDSYCAAYPDLEAALDYAFLHGSGGPIYAVGSSYSAALVIRLAAEHGDRLTGVAPFSPAGGRMEECAVDTWLPRVDGVAIAPFRPSSEMENESVRAQAKLFEEHGIQLFVSEGGVHGASMLDRSRAQGDTAPAWERLLALFTDS